LLAFLLTSFINYYHDMKMNPLNWKKNWE